MKIQYKLIISFLAIVCLFLIAGLIITANVIQMTALESQVSNEYAINKEAVRYQEGARQLQVGVYLYLQGNQEMGTQLITEGRQEMASSRQNLNGMITDPVMSGDLGEISGLETKVSGISDDIVTISTSSQPNRDALLNQRLATLQARVEALNLRLSNFVDRTNSNLLSAIETSQQNGAQTVLLTLGIIAATFVLALFMAWFIARQLTRPIRKLTEIADKVSLGNLEHDITVESDDEIGELSKSFRRMINAFKMMDAMSREPGDPEAKP